MAYKLITYSKWIKRNKYGKDDTRYVILYNREHEMRSIRPFSVADQVVDAKTGHSDYYDQSSFSTYENAKKEFLRRVDR